MTLGINNLKIAVVGMAAVITVAAALIDNGPGLDDLAVVKDAAPSIFSLKDLTVAQIMPELKDVDQAEAKELAELFEKHFDIKADTVEETIEKGFTLIFGALPFVLSIFNRAKLVPAT